MTTLKTRPWAGNSVKESGYVLESTIAVLRAMIALMPDADRTALRAMAEQILELQNTKSRDVEFVPDRVKTTRAALEDLFNT